MEMERGYTGWSEIPVSRATHGHAFQMGPSHMGFYMALPPSGHCLLPLSYSASQGSAHLPLGPIPAIHYLCVVLASVAIFLGCWEATAVELRETRWIWSRKFKNAAEWAMCFPLGTRPSGRVFFWSYIFYLTKYHQLFDTVIWILRKKPLTFLHVFHRVAVVFVCYAWLEFSQSLQIVTILATTLLYVVVYSYFLCRSIGWGCWSSFLPANWQMVHLAFTLLTYVALLARHFTGKEGCNGIGALLFDALSNITLLFLFLNLHIKEKCGNAKSLSRFSSSSSTCT